MKTGPDALGTAEKESGGVKQEISTRRHLYRRKMSLGAQNMKKGPDALGTPKNMSGSEKYENEVGRPRYRRK
jgi:hypothetical protein